MGAVIGAVAGGIIAYNAAKESGKEGDDLYAAMWGGVGKGAVIGAVGGTLIAATGGAMAGASGVAAGSTAGYAIVTGTATVAAKATEIATLQARKSMNDGDSGWQIADDCLDSLFNNGGKMLDSLSLKAGVTSAFYAPNLLSCNKNSVDVVSYLTATNNKTVKSYAFALVTTCVAWEFAAYAFFCDDPVLQANERGYVLQ